MKKLLFLTISLLIDGLLANPTKSDNQNSQQAIEESAYSHGILPEFQNLQLDDDWEHQSLFDWEERSGINEAEYEEFKPLSLLRIFRPPITRKRQSPFETSPVMAVSLRDKTWEPSFKQFAVPSMLHPKCKPKISVCIPSQEAYEQYIKLAASRMGMYEQAMFLANIVWETMGLRHMKEIACKQGNCVYGKYYGRGYIQLTWDYNYRAASYEIFGDDRLVQNPDLAATQSGAWLTALWYWFKYVRPALDHSNGLHQMHFGHTIRAINGGLECGHNVHNGAALARVAIYQKILRLWDEKEVSTQTALQGCA